MSDWIEVLMLGIIEGITEFLPISSTGHLLVAQQWLERRSDLFNVVIQSGAVAAVVVIFHERVKQLVFRWRDKEVQDYLFKLGASFFITGVGGLILKAMEFELPEEPEPVGWALLIGGIAFLGVERWLRGRTLGEEISWAMAIAIGLAQLVAAVFPGTSRSGATILIALIMGLNREKAIEFTFLLGVPTLLAAGGLKLASHFNDPDGTTVHWGLLIWGTVISGVTAFIAVKWLLHYVRSHTFEGFGWYRIAVGLLVLFWLG